MREQMDMEPVHRDYGSRDSSHRTSSSLESQTPQTGELLAMDPKSTWTPIQDSPKEGARVPSGTNIQFQMNTSPMQDLSIAMEKFQHKYRTMSRHKNANHILELTVYFLTGLYVLLAACLNFDQAKPVVVFYSLAVIFLVHRLAKPRYNNLLDFPFWQKSFSSISSSSGSESTCRRLLSCGFYISVCATIGFLVIFWNYRDPSRLISAGGLLFLVFFSVIMSKHKSNINWKTVFWGLFLQFAFGAFVLRTQLGFDIFEGLGTAARTFLNFSHFGIEFVFKPSYPQDTPNAVSRNGSESNMPTTPASEHSSTPMPTILGVTVLMIIPFFSAFISALYHLGFMQFLIGKIAWLMQRTMGTSATESMSAAGNIFVGQTEAPLLIKPFLQTLTMSELHAIMTGGFATIAGGVFAAYVSMGVSPSHLISASVMSAPAALSFSKIVYPEVEKNLEDEDEDVEEKKKPEDDGYENLVHAISAGATDGMTMVLNIIANLIAFLSLLAAVNYLVTYFGSLVNIQGLTLYMIFQYVFYPLAFLLGADAEDCTRVGELLGLKTIANEFLAYDQMTKMMKDDLLTPRSQVIATYALCGFSNLGSIGVQIGGMGALAPNRKGDLARIGISAFVTGNVACFSTACIAGLLYKSD